MKKNLIITYEISGYEKGMIDSLVQKVTEFINNKSTKSLEEMQAAVTIVSSIFRENESEDENENIQS